LHVPAPRHHMLLPPPRQNSPSACLPSRPIIWASPIGITLAPTRTHGLAGPHISPELRPKQLRRHCLVVVHRRAPFRPQLHPQLDPGEPNPRTPSHVCLHPPHLAGGEHTPAAKGIFVKPKTNQGPLC
jgi:hypothetical protein